MEPLVSVIMTAYNSEKFIKDSIESILKQTYTNLELIIIEDVSTDGTLNIIQQFEDERIRLLRNKKNSGTLYGMRKGVKAARGKYIAVLDSDDISFPDRIAKQVNFLETHKDILLCGSHADNIINGRRRKRVYMDIASSEELKFSLLFGNDNIVHSTVMFRKAELEKNQIEYERFGYCHDYYLILSVAAVGKIGLMDDILGLYRIHSKQKTHVLAEEKMNLEAQEARIAFIKKLYQLSDAQKIVLSQAIRGKIKTFKRLRALEISLKRYAEICGVDIKSKNLIADECTRLILLQEKNLQWLLFCIFSNLIDKKKILRGLEYCRRKI